MFWLAKRTVFLLCDTDVLAKGIWHERYMGCRSPDVEAFAASHRHDLYLLAGCDLPFVQDGLRDGETIRQWMTKRFEDALTECGLRWVQISGRRGPKTLRSHFRG
jgi:HTH-type transcriptional regulator, transcriptional repressor of NAD biosynthesis genes